jgi:hypothetical protein
MRIILALAALAFLCTGASAQTRPCDHVSWFTHASATGPVELVPGIADARIYPCGFLLLQKGNTLDFQMWGAPAGGCGLGPGGAENFTPQLSLPTDVQISTRIEKVGPSTALGHSMCIQTWGSGGLTGAIYWAQF